MLNILFRIFVGNDDEEYSTVNFVANNIANRDVRRKCIIFSRKA